MNQFDEQIQRIKNKLAQAKNKDEKFMVFGASRHQYYIGKPISEKEILNFEKKYNISLPDSYTAFLTKIGNSGKSYENSAAGPFYGIYPFGKNIEELVDDPKKYLSQPVKIYPKMTNEDWSSLGDTYIKEWNSLYAGLLPIGSQGCSYIHALVLNGKHRGKVVNIDIDNQKPIFASGSNFLDWYELWLDEILSGKLLTKDASWFGYKT